MTRDGIQRGDLFASREAQDLNCAPLRRAKRGAFQRRTKNESKSGLVASLRTLLSKGTNHALEHALFVLCANFVIDPDLAVSPNVNSPLHRAIMDQGGGERAKEMKTILV